MQRHNFVSFAATCVLLFCTVAAFAQQAAPGGDGNEASSPQATALALPSREHLNPPPFPTAVDPAQIRQLVSGSPWCGADDGQAVVILPPTGIPPSEINQALASLIYNEVTWSLSDVKRAVRLIGATQDPTSGRYLDQILSQASQIVSLRSRGLAARVRRSEIAQFQAYLQKATVDLRRTVTEQLPPQ